MPRKAKGTQICADCGAVESNWASVNTGVFICDECCSVHRTLGRQVSQVKSLKCSIWASTELQMIRDLYASGSNTIFEHCLVESSSSTFTAAFANTKNSRRKPCAKDALHPTKEHFIRSKYQNLMFINRINLNEETQTELNEQLHSSVRTPNLKTSLRLLISGANQNHLHPGKGNTPLIEATKSGLISQVELLLVYGADPLLSDVRGKTAFDYAKDGEHTDIAQRLIDYQYELTDRLSYFLCGRRPDHLSDQHFIIPEMSDSIDVSEFAKDAKLKLQLLPNRVFQEIAKDVYDEVDRRELNEIFCIQGSSSVNNQSVPFLPVTPQFSAIRNQGRQKLARYSAREFATLVIDILTECRRRQFSSNDPIASHYKSNSALLSDSKTKDDDDDSEPVYDSVASDDESSDDNKMDCNKTGHAVVEKMTFVSTQQMEQLLENNKNLQQQINQLFFIINNPKRQNIQSTDVYYSNSENSNPLSSNSSLHSTTVGNRPQSMFEGCTDCVTSKFGRPLMSRVNDPTFTQSKVLAQQKISKHEMFRLTEIITKNIQELLAVALENKVHLFLGSSQKILQVVKDIYERSSEAFDESNDMSVTKQFTEKLYNSALTLQSQCNVDYSVMDNKKLAQQVIESAYDVAKAAKELITKVMN